MPQAQSKGRSRAASQPLGNTSARLIAVHVKSANKNIFKALLSLASANLLVRVMGLGMQVVITYSYGISTGTDAYSAVYLFVTTLAQLITGGLEASVIPAYARVRVRGKEEASKLFSTLLNILVILLITCTVFLFIFRSEVTRASAPGLASGTLAIAINLAPYLLPVLTLMTLIGFMENLLNAEGQFGWPAYAGILVPISTAIVILVGKYLPFGNLEHGLVLLCVGNLTGLSLNLLAVLIRAHKAQLRYRPTMDLKNPEVKSILVMAMVPMFSALMGQLGPLVDQMFASTLDNGTITALGYATKISSVFTGVIFASVGRAALPYLASQAAIKDMGAFKGTLRLYIWAMGLGTAVLALGLIAFAQPVVHLMFERGHFDPTATKQVSLLLIGLAIGLPATALAFLTSRAFSALKKTKVLMGTTINFIVFNTILDLVFRQFWGAFGITLATSIVYFINMFVLLVALRMTIGDLNLLTPPPELLKFISKVGMGQTYTAWLEENLPSFGFTYAIRKGFVRAIAVLSIFAVGVAGTISNALFTLRVAFGSIVLLALMRYPYILLMVWIGLDALIGSTVSFLSIFQGGNLLSGLTIPTLVLMLVTPVKPAFKRMPSLAFLFGYLMWVFLTIGFSEIGIQQFLTLWLVYISYVGVGVLVINHLTTKRKLNWLIDAILLQGTFIAGFGIYGWFAKVQGVYDTNITTLYRTGSFYGDPPTLAFVLTAIFPIALYRTVTIKNFWGRLAALISMLTILIAFVLTFSRGPSVSFAISIMVLIFFLPTRNLRIGLLGGIAVAGAVGVMASVFLNIPILQRFLNNDLTTLNGRTLLWDAVLQHFNPTHLLGEGLNASNVLLAKLQVGQGKGIIATAPHNIFIGTLYDHGIIGVVLLVLILTSVGWGLLKKLFTVSPEHRLLVAAVATAFVNIAIQSFELTAIWMQSIGIYLWIIMALPFALCWDNEPRVSIEDEEVSTVETLHLEAIQPEKQELSHV